MKPNKLFRRLLALSLALALSLSLSPAALAAGEDDVFYIRTAEDLCTLSDRCALDTWSRGKRVVLTANLSLRGVDFEPIASFSGTFEGNGYTISGLSVTDSLSPAGLFLTVERGARIHSLKVEGQVIPGGTKESVGGIAGRNYGTLEDCSFFGIVKGDSAVGGIAGRNEDSGVLANCTVSGSVAATRSTGGITGCNLGTVRACINSASVNTANVDPTLSLDDLSIDAAASLSELVSAGAAETRNATSDTGGVAGYSSGSLLSCINRGTVGYPHYGYNVGGVVGRSSGYADACRSYGTVYGRKDVGGIVGQMEPYLHLSLRDDLLERLRTELDRLSTLISSMLDDIDRTSDHLSARLDSVSGYANAAVDDADTLAGQTTDFIDGNLDTVNELTGRVEDVLDAMPDILKSLESAADAADKALDAFAKLDEDLTISDADRSRLTAAASRIRTNSVKLRDAVSSLQATARALQKYLDGSTPWDSGAVRELLSDARSALSAASDAAAALVTDTAEAAAILARFLNTAAPDAHEDVQDALDALSDASSCLGDAVRRTRALVDDLNAKSDLTFTPLGDGYRDTLESLFDNLRGTMNELDALNGELQADSSALTEDLRAVNRQMSTVINLFLDIFTDMSDTDTSSLFEDTSETDVESLTQGKVHACTNFSAVDADLNVGGIAGSMAIEYELDPEDDAAESESLLNRVYETKAVIQRCVNRGDITVKKNCAGGIVGEMDLGLVTGCEAYGSARSETGSYIGGIAGLSSSAIRACWAKLTLSGKSGVGGIVGSGSEGLSVGSGCTVTDCRSLVQIDACEQFSGAIAGRDLGTFRGNLFVSDTLRGIDRRSIAGQAEPMDYADFAALDGIPDDLLRFTLKFVCDGMTLKTLTFAYGDSFDLSVFPSLTEQTDGYPVWDRTDLTDLRFDTVVTATYNAYTSALHSAETRADGRSIFFVEGDFQSRDSLTLTASVAEPASLPPVRDGLSGDLAFLSDRSLPVMTAYRAVVEQWTLSFPRDALAEHTIRYLPPDGQKAERCVIFVRQPDGSWQAAQTQSMGSYLLFTAPGESVELAVLSTATVWWLWLLCAALLAGVLALLIRLLRRAGRRHGRGAKNAAAPAAPDASSGGQDGAASSSAQPPETPAE